MKVLIFGSGGREHALAWACTKSPLKPAVLCAPGNGGTKNVANNISFSTGSTREIVEFVRSNDIDLTIIGPEIPLVGGLADEIRRTGSLVFGPSKTAARIEGSKAFAKKLMTRVGVPTAPFEVFTEYRKAQDYLVRGSSPIVVKADGLAAGKGAILCEDPGSALAVVEAMLVGDAFGQAGRKIVIEECLQGAELSMLAIVDGTDYLLLPPSRDHKRALDGDGGPNTGGMGAYAPLPDISRAKAETIAETVFPPVLSGLAEIGAEYSGCLYAGIMLTRQGPVVLEFNCRFGDPEAQVVLPLVGEDALEMMVHTAEGSLKDWMKRAGIGSGGWCKQRVEKHAVAVVAAAKGYPGAYEKGMQITSLPAESNDVIVFHAGTEFKADGYHTTGGRVLAVTGLGKTHKEAADTAYQAVEEVHFDGMRYRRDIGRSIR